MEKNKEVNKEMAKAENRWHFKEFCRTGNKKHLEELYKTGELISKLQEAHNE